jgi:hypothetical protein
MICFAEKSKRTFAKIRRFRADRVKSESICSVNLLVKPKEKGAAPLQIQRAVL